MHLQSIDQFCFSLSVTESETHKCRIFITVSDWRAVGYTGKNNSKSWILQHNLKELANSSQTQNKSCFSSRKNLSYKDFPATSQLSCTQGKWFKVSCCLNTTVCKTVIHMIFRSHHIILLVLLKTCIVLVFYSLSSCIPDN